MANWIEAEAPGDTLVEGSSGRPLVLPNSLHMQLFLLSYDRYRRRVDGYDRWRFGLALRTAMMTDLYLNGHLQDVDGHPRAVGVAHPADPVLRRVLRDVDVQQPTWVRAVAHDQRVMPRLVCSQLEAYGWLWVRRCRILGKAHTTRVLLNYPAGVSQLDDRVGAALRDAIAGRRTDDRLMTIGLIGALGELPTVFDFAEATRHADELRGLVEQAIPPIRAMLDVIATVHLAIRENDTGPYTS